MACIVQCGGAVGDVPLDVRHRQKCVDLEGEKGGCRLGGEVAGFLGNAGIGFESSVHFRRVCHPLDHIYVRTYAWWMQVAAHPTKRRSSERHKVRFPSGDGTCAAWHYPGDNRAIVVMAGGFAVPKEPGTDRFAAAFHAAGFSVLAFDYRGIGESDGEPRQAVRVNRQLADWDAAIDFVRTLPGVDGTKIVAWGFSLSGGDVLAVGARHPDLAAVIAQTPNADGRAASRNATRHQTPSGLLRFTGIALLDAIGSLLRRPPRLVPLAGAPGTLAVLTTPDALDGDRALVPIDGPCEWSQLVAARSARRVASRRIVPAASLAVFSVLSSSSPTTTTSRRSSHRRCGSRKERVALSSSRCPVHTTHRSSMHTTRQLTPSSSSSVDACSKDQRSDDRNR